MLNKEIAEPGLNPQLSDSRTLEHAVLPCYVVFQDKKSIVVGIHLHSRTLNPAVLIKQVIGLQTHPGPKISNLAPTLTFNQLNQAALGGLDGPMLNDHVWDDIPK